MQILVLGAHRSGTSLVTRLINMMDAYFGAGEVSIGFNEENPKGFWERRDVITVNEALLERQGCRWDELSAWEFKDAPKKPPKGQAEINDKIKNILLELDANRPWVVKDPRLCLTLPSWRPFLEVPVALIMTRDPVEVALSMQARNGFSLTHGLAIWEYYSLGILHAAKDMPRVFVTHAEILSKPYETVTRLQEELTKLGVQGLRLPNRQEVEAFIEPGLYRSKAAPGDRQSALTEHLETLLSLLQGKKKWPKKLPPLSALAQDAMRTYRDGMAKDARLEEVNRNHATLDQERRRLAQELELSGKQIQRLEEELVRRAGEIANLKASTSWRVGHSLVKNLKRLSFK